VAMTDEFEATVIVVTGAAGGIGQAVSSWLAARGARSSIWIAASLIRRSVNSWRLMCLTPTASMPPWLP
jgi:NADP-dependent 3-hydroxy acid dehydrogenase YdfG